MRINLKTLAEFIVNAKKSSWAGGAKETVAFGVRKIGPDVSRFQKFNLCYLDQYVNGEKDSNFQGLEVVSMQQTGFADWKPVWAMGYSGEYYGTNKEKENISGILKQALKLVPIDASFRGPRYFDPKPISRHGMRFGSESNYYYQNIWDGDIKWFTGNESIKRRHPPKMVHALAYSGGLIK